MLMQTRASGSDTDAQQRAMAAIRQAFDTAPGATPAARLVMTGPGVFSVTSRDTIKSQVSRLSIISVALIATLLLLVYRSFTALALGFLPVISGALAGIAAVSLGFGAVHGITLGFGTALIGEAVDYSIYLFVQSEQGGSDQQNWIKRFWPTVRLGVLTSIFGFASLLLSGFPGLAQLGLYSIAGLIAAATVTRFVLPHLLPANFRIHDVSAIGRRPVPSGAARRRTALGGRDTAAGGLRHPRRSTAPVCGMTRYPRSVRYRRPMWRWMPVCAPTWARPMCVIWWWYPARARKPYCASAEQVSTVLQTQVDQGELAGFESPSRYLPSIATQRARQASLPAAAVLETRLAQAVQGLPVRAQLFAPFLADVAAARSQPLLQACRS